MSVPVNVNHVRKALYPIFALAAVFGVQMFEYRVIILNYIQFIITWTIYTTIFCCLCLWSDFRAIFNNYTFRFVIFANATTSLMATALTLQHRKKFERVLEGLAIINDTFKDLDMPNGSSKLKKLMRKVIGIWCMTVLYVVLADGSWMSTLFGKLVGLFVFIALDYPYFVNTITYIISCVLLSYTKSRFDMLNKHIEWLTSEKGRSVCWSFKISYGETEQSNPMFMNKRKRDIWSLLHIHAELCRICRDLNTIFGVAVIFEAATYFISVSGLGIYLCELLFVISFIKPYLTSDDLSVYLFFRLIMASSWSCIYIGRLIYFNHICETISAEAHRTSKLMHNFLNYVKDSHLQAELRQFTLYMISRPLRFHGAGFFYFGYTFVYTFFMGIVTVLVILMQSMSHIERTTLGTIVLPENVTMDVEILPNDVILNSSLLKI